MSTKAKCDRSKGKGANARGYNITRTSHDGIKARRGSYRRSGKRDKEKATED